jgi:hypothetical protein
MIGNPVKEPGKRRPRFRKFKAIRKGDLAIYYAKRDMVVLGIFEIASKLAYMSNDPYWKESVFYRIKPAILPPVGKVLDFQKLVTSPNVHFDAIPSMRRWGVYLQGRACVLLTKRDYEIIEKAFSKVELLREIETLNEIRHQS